jgi:hypothetical protein
VIPTKCKERLPPHLSWPIGAEAIGRCLAGAPHVDLFTLSFLRPWRATSFQAQLRARRPCSILVARHLPARKPGHGAAWQSVEAGHYGEQWWLWVHPVARECRHVAHRLLEREGLPSVRQWLTASSRPGWTSEVQVIELVFDPLAPAISVRHRGSF